MNAPALLTVDQAVEAIFGEISPSSRNTLYKLIKSKQIESVRSDGDRSRIFIPLRAIKALRGEDD